MYSRNRQKQRTDSMQVTTGERGSDAEDDDDEEEEGRRIPVRVEHASSNGTRPGTSHITISNLVNPAVSTDVAHAPARQVAQILEGANLVEIAQLDWIEQIQYFVTERAHLINQLDHVRTQFDKQYNSLKRRLDETETDNEQLTAQHRTATKQLLLYKNLIEAPENSDSPAPKKDYQQLKLTIDSILKENERLYAELNEFKTSDPVYDQVKLLENANRHLKQELAHSNNQIQQLLRSVNIDEIQHLKTRLARATDECEQLRLLNKKLISEVDVRRPAAASSSPAQVRAFLQPPPSPASQRSRLTPPSSTVALRPADDSSPSLTIHNLRQLEIASQYPTPAIPTSSNAVDLKEHVHLLEQKLQQRDYELQTLQLEIEKGTSSIMSSIEDLCVASTSVSPPARSPNLHRALPAIKGQPTTIEELQNEIDVLHDKLDDVTRENQTLRNRTQEFDTIYEENEYLYAEKTHRNDELERARVRELVLEQEIRSLKEREKEFLVTNDTAGESPNSSQLKLKVEWLHRTNNELELENVRIREQLDTVSHKCQELKKELLQKEEHFQQVLSVAQDQQQLPQELIRLEKVKANIERQLEKERHEYEKTIRAMEEHGEKREQKYSTLYDTILKLQNDYRQKELDYVQQMDEVLKQRGELHSQLTILQNEYAQIQQENKALRDEIKSKDDVNRDLKLALSSSNNDAQTTFNQLRQVNTNLVELQQKYERDMAERNRKLDSLQSQNKQMTSTHDEGLLKTHQTIVQLQHENKQYASQVEHYRSNLEKLQAELDEKKHFIERVQSDLTERSAFHVNMSNQLTQENKVRMTKIANLEHALSQEQQRKSDLQRTIHDLQMELLKSRAVAKESMEKNQELERRLHETDRHFEDTVRCHLADSAEPTRRELTSLRAELVAKSDQVTLLQYAIDEEKLKRQRLEMKLKRLKEEYISVRKELYNRIEEINGLQHELVECRFKNDYNLHLTNQTLSSLKSSNETDSSNAVQLYLKEKADSHQWQMKCRAYQQKIDQLQRHYELTKEKYKERLHEERELFERAKHKYLDHIKNVQHDLHETRQLLEKDAAMKSNQDSAYQQLIDERRQLLTSMVDKDAKVREMRRENLLLTSKIQLLEDQMENLNERVDRTLRERNQFRREIQTVRLDGNLAFDAGSRSPSNGSPTRSIIYTETTSRNQPIQHAESFGFDNARPRELTPSS